MIGERKNGRGRIAVSDMPSPPRDSWPVRILRNRRSDLLLQAVRIAAKPV